MSDSLREEKQKTTGKRTSILIGVGLAVAVLLLVVTVFWLLKTTKVAEPAALVVGERQVSKAQLEEYISLGKKSGADEKTVRQEVVEYEKNQQMAEKYNISIPDSYVSQIGNQASVDIMALSRSSAAPTKTDNAYTRVVNYNEAFDARLAQQGRSGYGVFVYEITAQKETSGEDDATALTRAKSVATNFRNKIVNDKQSPADVLTQVKKYNSDYGQAAKTGTYFIEDSKDVVDDSSSGSLLSNAFILQQLKGKGVGVTDVLETKVQSAFFVDVLYEQKQRASIEYEVQRAKETMKVVIYDI